MNLALVVLGAVLAAVVVADMIAGAPPPRPAEATAKRIAAVAPTRSSPAPSAPAELASTAPASTTPALDPARARAVQLRPPAAGLGAAAARPDAPAERAAVPATLARAAAPPPARPEDCATCGDEVPF